jgi:hypothetical protein
VDGGVPEVDGSVVAGGSVGWWHGRSLLLGVVVVVMNPTKSWGVRGALFWFLYMRYGEKCVSRLWGTEKRKLVFFRTLVRCDRGS